MKLLNMTDDERKNCTVTYNVNRFEVYGALGNRLTAAYDKASLKQQLSENRISAKFDGIAQRKYLLG
jgi:hypothetical protein